MVQFTLTHQFSSLEKKHSLVVFHFNLVIKGECLVLRTLNCVHCVHCVMTNIYLCALFGVTGADFSSELVD